MQFLAPIEVAENILGLHIAKFLGLWTFWQIKIVFFSVNVDQQTCTSVEKLT